MASGYDEHDLEERDEQHEQQQCLGCGQRGAGQCAHAAKEVDVLDAGGGDCDEAESESDDRRHAFELGHPAWHRLGRIVPMAELTECHEREEKCCNGVHDPREAGGLGARWELGHRDRTHEQHEEPEAHPEGRVAEDEPTRVGGRPRRPEEDDHEDRPRGEERACQRERKHGGDGLDQGVAPGAG